MIAIELKQYFARLSQESKLQLAAALSSKQPGSLHSMRVNAKQQLAFFDWLAALDDSFPLATARKPTKAFMRKSSKLRDGQMTKELRWPHGKKRRTGKTAPMPREKQTLKPSLKFAVERAGEVEPVVHACLARLAARGDAWESTRRYFLEQVGLIGRMGAGPSVRRKKKEMHRLRKEVKTLLYNLRAFADMPPGHPSLDASISWLDDFQHLLGDWNDRVVALKKLKKKHPDKQLRKGLKNERRLFFGRILIRLHGLPGFCTALEASLIEAFSRWPRV